MIHGLYRGYVGLYRGYIGARKGYRLPITSHSGALLSYLIIALLLGVGSYHCMGVLGITVSLLRLRVG